MRTRVSSTEVARNLGDFLARIKHRGDQFVITRNGRPVAELGPVAEACPATLGQLWEVMREARADDGFAADLEAVNKADELPENPWA